MPDSNNHQAMIIPKGAKIIAGDGGDISIDVQGDLILQENQKGLTSLSSRHGSILIDDGVQVHASNINSKHMIRIRGSLTIESLEAEAVMVDGGTLRCSAITTGNLEAKEADLTVKSIKADTVSIRGGSIEIGTIHSQDLKIRNKVRGSLLIANAKEREIDESVRLKGGFESDVELLGYLMKYRDQVLSERVVAKLEASEASKLKRILLESGQEEQEAMSSTAEIDEGPEDIFEQPDFEQDQSDAIDVDAESISADSEADGDSVDSPPDFKEMQQWASELESEMSKAESSSAVMKLILTGLKQGDTDTLRTIFTRWQNNVSEEKKSMSEAMRSLIEDIEYRIV